MTAPAPLGYVVAADETNPVFGTRRVLGGGQVFDSPIGAERFAQHCRTVNDTPSAQVAVLIQERTLSALHALVEDRAVWEIDDAQRGAALAVAREMEDPEGQQYYKALEHAWTTMQTLLREALAP